MKKKSTIYVFGNEDYAPDSIALIAVERLIKLNLEVEFVVVKPNQDLPFIGEDKVVIMDNIAGIEKVTLIEDKDLDKLVMSPRNSVHDFDLGFQIKYLKKLGKLGEVRIIGLPMEGKIDIEKLKEMVGDLCL